MLPIYIPNPEELIKDDTQKSSQLDQYLATLKIEDACTKDYQKNYTAYYNLRRDKIWLMYYYDFLFLNKNNKTLTFGDVIEYLLKVPAKTTFSSKNPNGLRYGLECSFGSKLLHTIDPNFPIWDSRIRNALLIPEADVSWPMKDRVRYSIDTYKELTANIHNFINSEQGQYCIEVFNNKFPEYKDINNVKKIDYYLFTMGRNKGR